MPEHSPYRVAVIGAGFGGIGMAIALQRAGHRGLHRSSTRPTTSAAPGGTTPTPAPPATSLATCTRSRSGRAAGAAGSRRSRRSWPTCRRWPTSTGSARISGWAGRDRRRVRRRPGRCGTSRSADGDTIQAASVVSAVGPAQPARPARHPRPGRLRRPVLPLRPLGSRHGPDRQAGRRHRHRRQRHPVRARDRQAGRARGRVPAHAALRAAEVRRLLRRGPAGHVRPAPGRAQGRPAAHLPVRRAAHQRLRRCRRDAGGPDAAVAPAARGDHRPGAAGQLRPGLRDGLQAGAVLQRLVPGPDPAARRAGHRPIERIAADGVVTAGGAQPPG